MTCMDHNSHEDESGTLASTIRIEMKRPDMAGRLTEINL